MPSPFPGMNPFLEQADVWEDLHNSYLLMLREQLVPQLPSDYIAKIGEHLYIQLHVRARGRVSLGRETRNKNRPKFLRIKE